jgi:hypothetical protein
MPEAEAILLALKLLGTGPDPRVKVVSRETAPIDWNNYRATEPRAFTRSDDDHIYIGDWSDTFKRARSGDQGALRSLAGMIAHEQFHKDVTKDEGPAYQKELEVLESLRAPGHAIDKVRQAQRTVAPRYRVLKSKPLQFGVNLKDIR